MAIKHNTIVFQETGSGKTLVAIMLLRSYAHFLQKPSSSLAVFLVPTGVLVSQQAEVVQMHTDLKVGKYWGEMGVDFWNAADWKKQQDEFEVLVMTPQILLNALRHSFIKLETIRILIFDECHHARGRHPYACIMTEFYHPQLESNNLQLPRILGMTASPINTKGSSDKTGYWKQIHELENLMNSKVFTCSSESVKPEYLAMSTPKLKSYTHVDIPYSLSEKMDSELKTLKEKVDSSQNKDTVVGMPLVQTAQQLSADHLHFARSNRVGALMDNLVPDMVEEKYAEEMGHVDYVDEHDIYVPSELVGQSLNNAAKTYFCYMLELDRSFSYDIPMDHLMIAASSELNFGEDNIAFELEFDRGSLTVHIKYSESISLTSEQVFMCQQFQVKLFRVLYNKNFNKLKETIDVFHLGNDRTVYDYLLLPTTGSQKSLTIDWRCVRSILFKTENICHDCPLPEDQYNIVQTRNGLVCRCVLENSLVCTPHNGYIYCILGTIDGMNGSSVMNLKDGESTTYKTYYATRHGIDLQFEREHFLKGRHIFPVQNHLHKHKKRKEQERSNAFVELPPELCSIVMPPISVGTWYTFSFASAIMHRIESLLIASSLKKMHADYCNQNVSSTTKIPTIKVLEAITTKKCQEKFDLGSLATLGDSFLKYAACQQVFKMHQDKHEGILSIKKEKIISNSNLCKLGCSRKLPGLIRNEPFDPKMWIIPGDQMEDFHEVQLSTGTKVFTKGTRKIKSKVVADVVEALIGVFLSCGGEVAALSFMNWLGIEVDFRNVLYERSFLAQPKELLNISYLESILKYSFSDATLLVEALTHGSFMLPQIPQCYQRLEFLGDAVLDYLITMHLYKKYPGMSPGLLTDLRSASVNNNCYSLSAVKVGLQKHILHASQTLHRQIVSSLQNLDPLLMGSTFGWESENSLPKVLGDVIESLAGAILVDSGYDKDIVFKSILPLLEPLVSPVTLKLQPVRELHQLCQKENYVLKKPVVSCEDGVAAVTIEVEASGIIYKESCTALNKAEARKLASKAVLKSLKESMSTEPHPIPFLSSPKGKK